MQRAEIQRFKGVWKRPLRITEKWQMIWLHWEKEAEIMQGIYDAVIRSQALQVRLKTG